MKMKNYHNFIALFFLTISFIPHYSMADITSKVILSADYKVTARIMYDNQEVCGESKKVMIIQREKKLGRKHSKTDSSICDAWPNVKEFQIECSDFEMVQFDYHGHPYGLIFIDGKFTALLNKNTFKKAKKVKLTDPK